MLRVALVQAKPGMTLALPVFHPKRHDTVLLNAGVRLDARTIDRLRELNLREVWIRYPGMDFIAEYISPAVFEAHAGLTWQMSRAFDEVSANAKARLDYSLYRRAISSLLERLLENPKSAIFIQEMVDCSQPTLRHSSSVCMISLLMGLRLVDYLIAQRTRLSAGNARDVSSLGVAAMLHDIGMLRLDPAVVARWNATQDESDPEWREHVNVGYEMVRQDVGPTAAATILHHHQKFDGTGFPTRVDMTGRPQPVAGEDIHIFARILAAADLFDRLRYPPGSDRCVPAVRALKRMQEPPCCRWIDPIVFKALLSVVPAYAPGTQVRLSNGLAAVVVAWFPENPCRPTVQTIGDLAAAAVDGEPHEGQRYVLRSEPNLHIVEAEGEDVRADNFYPRFPGEFDLQLATRAVFNSAAQDQISRQSSGLSGPSRPETAAL